MVVILITLVVVVEEVVVIISVKVAKIAIEFMVKFSNIARCLIAKT